MIYYAIDNLTLRKKQISKSDCDLLKDNVAYLVKSANEIDYYRLIKHDLNCFIELQDKIHVQSEDNFILLNASFANWLNAFYMWVTFHNHNHNDFFVDLASEYRKKSNIFRLASIFRNYETHDSFAIDAIVFDVLKEKSHYLIHLDKMVEIMSGKVNANDKAWLLDKISNGELDNSIDAIEYAKEFVSVFESIQHEIWNKLSEDIICAYNRCINTLNFDYSDLYNLSIKSDDTEIEDDYGIGQVLSNSLKKIRDNYPNMIV